MSLGLPEVVVIAALVLIFLGPKRMPEVLRSLGRAWVEVKRVRDSMVAPLHEELDAAAQSLRSSDTADDLAALRKELEDGNH